MKASGKIQRPQRLRDWHRRHQAIRDVGYGHDRLPDDEVLLSLARERPLVLNHIPSGLRLVCRIVLCLVACAEFAGWLGAASALAGSGLALRIRTARQPASFLVLLFALSVAGLILQPAASTFSRHFEHEADVYGQEAIHGLVADPQKTAVPPSTILGEAWLEDPDPNHFVEFWTYSHPSVQNRAKFCIALRSVGERRAWEVL